MAEATLCAIRIVINSKGNIEIEKSKADISAIRTLLDAFDVDGVEEMCDFLTDVQASMDELNTHIINKYKAL